MIASLPEPSLSCTFPSLHDGTPLDCRVYHPVTHLSPRSAAPPSLRHLRHVAVIAHPYPPMGGCFDDPVVGVIGAALLDLGFIVGTFNFRGASRSAGRTSWTGNPERMDYASFTGFMVYYIHHLEPHSPSSPSHSLSSGGVNGDDDRRPTFLIGGYSYGALITSQLPALHTILEPFKSPAHGSAAADICLRAENLAAMAKANASFPRRSVGVRTSNANPRRRSHDDRRSFSLDAEPIRKGVHELRSRARRHRRTTSAPSASTIVDDDDDHEGREGEQEASSLAPNPDTHDGKVANPSAPIISIRPAYLLISPLQGLVSALATLSILQSSSSQPPPDAEEKLTRHPTLAIYGDQDVFVTASRLRRWAARLESRPRSRFRAHEVSGAGHFWAVDERALRVLMEVVREFAGGLLVEGG